MDRRLLPLFVPLALALAGCSGTPFGEQLSGSFPEGEDASPPAPAQGPAAGTGPGSAAAPPPASPPRQSQAPAPAQPPAAAPAPPGPPPAPVTVTPAPYRLTLRLTGADPSAPAEAVTRALRAAGLVFEVEVIERIPDATTPAPPASTPAPEPRSPPAPR